MRLTPEATRRLFHWTVEKIKTDIGGVLNSPDGLEDIFLARSD